MHFFSNVILLGFAISYFIIIGSSHLVFGLGCLLVQNKLGLDESMTRQAMQLFNETKHIVVSSMSSSVSGSVRLHSIYLPSCIGICLIANVCVSAAYSMCVQPEEIERSWSSCVLYCVSRLSKAGKSKEDGVISLCQILRASKLR
jgi:retinoblastoma-like protein 1